VARKHALKLRELRQIRVRFVILFIAMAAVTLALLAYLAGRVFFSAETLEYLDFASLCFYGLASLVMTVAQLALLRHLTVRAGRRIEEITYTDELTRLGNRRGIARYLSEEFREAQLSRNPLSLLFIDLDAFKPINDRHSHATGDLVLRAVSHALRESVREADYVGRAGGDEFLILLPDTNSQSASVVAHRIAARLAELAIGTDGDRIEGLTASIGISSYPANAVTRPGLIEDADRAMYAAKRSGRGQIVISITRPAGPEPKASAAEITEISHQLAHVVERGDRDAPRPEEAPHG
jgi:diguanylate cyclase (GGDEF)-like protein